MNTSKTTLKQTLGLFTAIMVVVSAMIGSGVFKKAAPMAAELGNSTAIILCWAVAGIITLFGALSNAEVGSHIAKPGGQYVYFKRMYGKPFAFLYGWASFSVIQTATSASVAFVFAESLNELYVLPQLSETWTSISIAGITPFENFGVKLVAILCIILITIINTLGVENGGMIGNLLASTILVSMAILVFCGFFLEAKTPELISIKPVSTVTSNVSLSTFFTAMLAAFWAFEGWNTVGFLGGEIKNAKRFIPIALGLGVLIVVANYVLVNTAFLEVLNLNYFVAFHQANEAGGNIIPATEVMRALLGKQGAIVISILILLSTFNTSNNTIMTSPRIYYAMAKDKVWWNAFGKIHTKFRTPHIALMFHALISILFVLSSSFDMLTDMLILVAFIFYGAGAWGVFVVRKKMIHSDTKTFRVPSFVPIVFVVFSMGLIANSMWVNTIGSLTGILIVLGGLPIYFYFNYLRKSKYKRRLPSQKNKSIS